MAKHKVGVVMASQERALTPELGKGIPFVFPET